MIHSDKITFLGLENTTITLPIRPTQEIRVENLLPGKTYEFCIVNAYFSDPESSDAQFCQILENPKPLELKPEPVIESTTQRSEKSGFSLGLLIATLGCAIGLITIILLVAAVLWRKRRYLQLKNASIGRSSISKSIDDQKISYSQKLISSTMSPQPDLTMDASKEFAVTLMLRAPPSVQNGTHVPNDEFSRFVPYTTRPGLPDIYDIERQESNRLDSSLYI